jgi:tetratricopeptide (TPR) repeat protein
MALEMIERYPYEPEPRVMLAELYLGIEQYDRALQQCKALAQMEPHDHVVWSLLGSAELGLKHFDEAVKAFNNFVALEPGSASSHHLLADSYRARGQLNLAAKEYGNALGIDLSFHFATVGLANRELLTRPHGRSGAAAIASGKRFACSAARPHRCRLWPRRYFARTRPV